MMKAQKLVAMLLVCCMVLSVFPAMTMAEENVTEIHNGYTAEVTMGTHSYSFTPEESGTYYFYTTYGTEQADWGPLFVYSAEGEELVSGYVLVNWQAEAGVTYQLTFDCWYEDPVMLHLAKETDAESVETGFDELICYVGDVMYFEPVLNPYHSARVWNITSSDETVGVVNWDGSISWVGVGTTTITVTAQGGAQDSFVATVIEMPEVTVGEYVQIGESAGYKYSFTPETDGCYSFHSDCTVTGIPAQIFIYDGNGDQVYYGYFRQEGDDLVTFLDGGVTYIIDIFYNVITADCFNHWVEEIPFTPVESIEVVDDDMAPVVENAYINSGNEGIYEFDIVARDLKIRINYTDGTSETVPYNAEVNGFQIENDWNWDYWAVDRENLVTFSYLNASVDYYFQVIENPVDRIEILKDPTTVFEYRNTEHDYGIAMSDGVSYYFYPECYGGLAGLEFQIFYKDGTSETVTYDQISWAGTLKDYPSYNGYALSPYFLNEYGHASDTLMMREPGEVTMVLEYMGATDTYTVLVQAPAHVLTKVEAVEPTYTAPGNVEYYTCSHCDKWFADADATVEITDKDSVILPQLVQVEEETVVVSEEAVEQAIEDAGDSGEVVLPLEDAGENIAAAEVPVSALDAVAEAGASLTVELSDASVTLDSETLTAILASSSAETVTLTVAQTGIDSLLPSQQAVLEEESVAVVISAELLTEDAAIHDFNGGMVTLRIPFAVGEGEKAEEYKVLYLAEDGTVETIVSGYENGCLVFCVDHFSVFAVVKTVEYDPEEPTEPAPPADPENPATGDERFMPAAFLFCASVLGITVLILMRRKHI